MQTNPPPLHRTHSEDESQLNALKITHYVLGGLMTLFGLFPLIHIAFGLAFITGNGEAIFGQPIENGQSPPAWFGWLFVIVGLLAIALIQAMAWCVIISGRKIGQREGYMFSFVVACVACTLVPIGTILGIFTIIVLSRDSVKALYGRNG